MTQSIQITAPLAGTTVSGTVTVQVVPVNLTVAEINFEVDGKYVGKDTTPPFSWTLDTTKLANGQHTIKAVTGNGKYSASVFLEVANGVTPPPPPPPPPPNGPPVPVGALLFGEEFDGTALDTTKWGAQNRTSDGGGVWDSFTHVSLDGQGNLVIKAVSLSGTWHSGLLVSLAGYKGPRYIESRAKVPAGQGTWAGPLWEWSYPYGKATDGGPNVENDVCEQLGREPDAYNATFHNWNHTTNPRNGQLITASVPLADGFHVYGAAVYKDHVDYYLDGVKVGKPVSAASVGLSDLATPKMTANVGLDIGGWGGAPSLPGPVELLVDYVRVHQLAP